MAAGIVLGPNDINNVIGGMARSLNVTLGEQIPQIYNTLQTIGAAGLEASPFNFSPTDAATIMTAIGDLNTLYKVYIGSFIVTAGGTPGTGTPTAGNGYDFRTFAQRLWGFGY